MSSLYLESLLTPGKKQTFRALKVGIPTILLKYAGCTLNIIYYLLTMEFYRFILYTKKNPTDGQILNVNVNKTIVKSNFSPTRLTKLIIHGFIDTPLSNWVIINRHTITPLH